MKIGLQEWIIIIGAIILVAILVHGYWSTERRKHKRNDNENSENDLFDDFAKQSMSATEEFGHGEYTTQDQMTGQEDEPYISMGGVSKESQNFSQDPVFTDEKFTQSHSGDDHGIHINEANKGDAVNSIIVISVMAKEGGTGFFGPDLLQAVLACGMRFGEMDIFHRHEGTTGSGAIQFSMANSVEPGGFDMENMEQFNTPGVTFFLDLSKPENPMQAFDLLIETIQYLVDKLDGVVKDHNHNEMTVQMFEQYRNQVFEYEQMHITKQN